MARFIVKFFSLIFLIPGLYLLNSFFNIFNMPGFILAIEHWIHLVAAVLLIFYGFKFFNKHQHSEGF